MEQLNRASLELVDEAIEFAEELNLRIHHLDNDAVVLDFGVHADGGIEAGILLAEIATGGLATIQTRLGDLDGSPRLAVELTTDHPELALLRSGKAGWALDHEGFEGVASGPAQLLRGDDSVREDGEFAVLAVESSDLPGEAVAERVAGETGIPTSATYLAAVGTGSPAGSVSVAARAAEVALHRLERLGYDVGVVRSVAGTAPVAPVAPDERALARTNDAIAHGGRVHLLVDEPIDRLEELPYAATEGAGRSIGSALEGWDFAAYDDLFAPAQVTVDVVGGGTTTVGSVDEARLAELLGR